ncbi:MAG: class I mannose-6-phosphate isomerase [Planctomycetes bacterium]|nr:class I mannose-6-phosphate isomerase [Planctomycetota bacterium]MCB9911558.1 class I mannose-6-phosphate isomerase [Planctomycetota bacterium]HPF13251.1 class I mannose-6-phosphate isomerase [Planctomycetota bacterium]HRV80653.1 class I mannose-6-phosphate isomerase [Planctomycetota bacterium]
MVLQEPLLLRPSPKAKIWGGDALAGCMGIDLGSDGPIGEVWTLADREEGSNEVASGSFAGRRLRGLMLSERSALLGTSKVSPEGTFPLLVKLIDADRDLSVQVHPDQRRADLLGEGAEAKDEFWYILDAREGARLYLGLKPGVDATTFAAKAHSADVVDLLQEFPVKRGDSVLVPAGTVHSIGAGITLVEVQQNSDTTYRIYDWGRKGLDGLPRECHLEKALQSIDFEAHVPGPYRAETALQGVNPSTVLVDTAQFSVEHLSVHAPVEHDTAGRAWAYLVLSGHGELHVDEVPGEWRMQRGETWLLPASLGRYRFHSPDGDFKVLRIEAKA